MKEKELNGIIENVISLLKSDPVKSIEISERAILLSEELGDRLLIAKSYRGKALALMNKGELNLCIEPMEKALGIFKELEDMKECATTLMNYSDMKRAMSDFKSSRQLLEEALTLFMEIGYTEGIARSNSLMGNLFLVASDFENTIKYYTRAIELFELLQMDAQLAGVYSNLGGVFYHTGDFSKALEYFHKALTINEVKNNKLWTSANLLNIGNLYFELKDPRSLEYFEKALKISEELNAEHSIATIKANIGSVHLNLNEAEKAYSYFSDSLRIARRIGDSLLTISTLQNIGEYFFRSEKYEDAYRNFNEGLTLSRELGSNEFTANSMITLGNWFFKAPDEAHRQLGFDADKKFEKAEKYYKECIKLSDEKKLIMDLIESLKCLSEVYEHTGKYRDSLKTYKRYIELRDQVTGEESKKQVTRKEMQYDFDKKEALARADQEKKDALALKELQRQKLIRNTFVGGFSAVLVFAGIFFKQRNNIKKGKKLSDELLLNILPEEVAEELKAKGHSEAKQFDRVTVMFTDFKGFTKISEKLTPAEIVKEIDLCFKAFDEIISKHNIEKIKTIGDSYMCAGGLPVENSTNHEDVINAAIEIRDFMTAHKEDKLRQGKDFFEIRTGIHTGPVVAGIVGLKKFAYDIWGSTVNMASRMESSGEVGMINISGTTYELVKDKYECIYRGKIEAKNIGETEMYFVEGRK